MNNAQWNAHLDTLTERAEASNNPHFKSAVAGVIEATRDEGEQDADAPHGAGAGVLLSSVEERDIEWLWEGHLVVGMVSVLTGPGGLGKSSYARHIAASATRSAAEDAKPGDWPMPDGNPCLLPGGVITAFMEEPLAEVVVPRLKAAGADMSLVRDISRVETAGTYGATIKRPFCLHDIAALEQARRAVGATLVIIDSLTSALGDVSKYNSQKLYDTLNDLAEWAGHAGCAVLIIAHPPSNASPKKPASYISGSASIFNNVRIVDLMLPDASQPGVTVVCNIKNNVHAPMAPLGFHRLPNDRLEFLHGMSPTAEKVQAARRLGDAMTLLRLTLDTHHERTYSSQELAVVLEEAGLSVEFGTVRTYLSRLVKNSEIQAVPNRRNAYASLLYKASAVTSVASVTNLKPVKVA